MENLNEEVRTTRLMGGMIAAKARYLSYMKAFRAGDGLAELLENLREDVPFVLLQQKSLEEAARRMTLAEERGHVPEAELAKGKAQLAETLRILKEALEDVNEGLNALEARVER